MRDAPTLYTLKSLSYTLNQNCTTGLPDGTWVPARPVGLYSLRGRFRIAWLVFTGRADAFRWPGDQ